MPCNSPSTPLPTSIWPSLNNNKCPTTPPLPLQEKRKNSPSLTFANRIVFVHLPTTINALQLPLPPQKEMSLTLTLANQKVFDHLSTTINAQLLQPPPTPHHHKKEPIPYLCQLKGIWPSPRSSSAKKWAYPLPLPTERYLTISQKLFTWKMSLSLTFANWKVSDHLPEALHLKNEPIPYLCQPKGIWPSPRSSSPKKWAYPLPLPTERYLTISQKLFT